MAVCISCDFENPAGMKFCGSCGAHLSQSCPQCAADIQADFNFCAYCGTPLRARAQHRTQDGVPERRQITALFCDLVDYTALSARLDPEVLRKVVIRYQEAATRAVQGFGGFVAQHQGDGLMVYFGYPSAHEDDPARAVAAALELIDVVANLDVHEEIDDALQVRIGVHTGPVVTGQVGSGDHTEHLALGSVPVVAVSIQDTASPGTVVISETTFGLVSATYLCRGLGARNVSGSEQALQTFVVEHAKPLTALSFSQRRPMLGRDAELDVLLSCLERARNRRGQVVEIVGAAGVGKTRLVEALLQHDSLGDTRVLRATCSQFKQASALAPVADMSRVALGMLPDETAEQQLTRIRDLVMLVGMEHPDSVALLCGLFGVEANVAEPQTPPEARIDTTIQLMINALLKLSTLSGVVLCVDDVQWADPSTLIYLSRLAEASAEQQVAIVLTSRHPVNVYFPPAQHTRLELGPVDTATAAGIVRGVCANRNLPAEVLDQIVARTDGVPLYIEEFTKTLLESGQLKLNEQGNFGLSGAAPVLPESLLGSLTERLDRLGEARRIAQYAAVFGREFDRQLLIAAWPEVEAEIDRHLSTLLEADLIKHIGDKDQGLYQFRHALLRDAAYELLLRKTRSELHAQVADMLISQFGARVAAQPEQVAMHLSEAEDYLSAMHYWLQAGLHAQSRAALDEACSHFEAGLRLADKIDPEEHPAEMELEILSHLLDCLRDTERSELTNVQRYEARADVLREKISAG